MLESAAIAKALLQSAQNRTIRYTKDIAGDDWYIRPGGVTSSMIWTLGHIALYRAMMYYFVTGEQLVSESWNALFQTGTEPSDNAAIYPTPDELIAFLDLSKAKIETYLESATAEDLAGPIAMKDHPFIKTKLQAVTVLPMHEAQHSGSMAIVRRLLGKDRII